MSDSQTRSITFGPRSFFRGIGYVVGTPSVWPLAIVPVLVSLTLFGVATYFGVHLVNDYFAGRSPASNEMATIANAFLIVLAMVVVVLGAFLLSVTLAQPLSGPAFDALCRRRWELLGGETPAEGGWIAGIARSLRVTLAGLLVALVFIVPLSVVTALVPALAVVTVPLKVVVAAFVLAWDVLDYPFSLQVLSVRERIRFIRANAVHVLAFGLMCEVALLIPGIGLLILPMAASGATDLLFGLSRRAA